MPVGDGVDGNGQNGIHRDTGAFQFRGGASHNGQQRGFGRSVGGVVGRRVKRGRRADHNNAAVPGGAHGRDGGAHPLHGGPAVHLHHPQPSFRSGFGHPIAAGKRADEVNQRIELSEACERGLHGECGARGRGCVSFQAQDGRVARSGEDSGPLAVDGGYPEAGSEGHFSDWHAETAAGARNQRHRICHRSPVYKSAWGGDHGRVSQTLAPLRRNLDFGPSPSSERPGLLIRDPFQFSDKALVIPPPLIEVLELFDGTSTRLDLQSALVEMTGQLQVSELADQLASALQQAGFLEDATYEALRSQAYADFAAAPVRAAAMAGGAYPGEADELREVFSEYMTPDPADPALTDVPAPASLIGIAAPHVSRWGGAESYRDAYRALGPDHREKIFVVLGTSHYGQPERFGLTRKNFVTPIGEARTERALVDRLAAAALDAVNMEDYCHRNEHSIEFPVAFLQHVYEPDVRILPVLCGPFAKSLFEGALSEEDENVKQFFGALGELQAAHAKDLLWVMGVDMAHVGRRYGHEEPPEAYQAQMLTVSARDK